MGHSFAPLFQILCEPRSFAVPSEEVDEQLKENIIRAPIRTLDLICGSPSAVELTTR